MDLQQILVFSVGLLHSEMCTSLHWNTVAVQYKAVKAVQQHREVEKE